MADYLIDDDGVLKNKLGITDPNDFKEAEQEIVTNKTAEILNEAQQTFDLDYLLHIHRVLFEDIYDFAGNIRTVDIAKPDASTPFCYVQFLEAESRRVFDKLANRSYLINLDIKDFIKEIVILAVQLNALHPFREGNGRVIRLFLIMLTNYAGYLLDYSQVSADELINADKRAFESDDKLLLLVYGKAVTR